MNKSMGMDSVARPETRFRREEPILHLSRRGFLKHSALAAVSAAGFSFVPGCARDPVTGRSQLMMLSRDQEIGIDRQQTPFQFSSDYGITQDRTLNDYVGEVGKKLLPQVHRPDMPYNFQCVNGVYVNAYAFPGGSIAVTRGILLELGNEAELASVLGHELGHVNARHSAEQLSRNRVSSMVLGGLSILAGTQGSGLGELTQQLGALGQGLFLSKYSRDNEREADELGHAYMVKSGYSSRGFVGLMEMLNSMNTSKPSSTQILFATHPMSSERLTSAVHRDETVYKQTRKSPLNRDRFMDKTASLRKRKKAVKQMQEGERLLAREDYDKAETAFRSALMKWEGDYTAQVLMAKCMLIREKAKEAASHAARAKDLYPSEPQGHYISGLAHALSRNYDRAYQDFKQCDRLLPGNPQLIFYRGYSLEKTGKQKAAANDYASYLKMINYQSNQYSQYAYSRLKAWGYVK
ncbi:M48 family metalloprotease [Desulfospira joergensenii]|uniref:M48 family metalloprotease n=1 Tax=Desulfospira joergensenii TaxID=53329 RepID=UPI0003B5A11B|nr:M48 family metalloprotease [Desulfospira joergensenii]